ncbi:hypothetical protein [Mesorhizobium sp. 113-3-3]|uniref:hypothetical protein n=1 Tax=Mesorhizobium sp. 113-3-3 TaxID=2744516 RepID=UPI001928ECB3|nr:hypothetical protein [Mesorhizobium sp. 113-3-3]
MARTAIVYEQIRNWLKAADRQVAASAALLQQRVSLVSLHSPQLEERIMAKGAMKAGKEARKPKKDAKKPAPAPALKAPPVKAMRIKEK